MNNVTKIRVHRFYNQVALWIDAENGGMTETVYLTPEQAKCLVDIVGSCKVHIRN